MTLTAVLLFLLSLSCAPPEGGCAAAAAAAVRLMVVGKWMRVSHDSKWLLAHHSTASKHFISAVPVVRVQYE